MTDQISRGLEGVVVAESALSRIDGDNGELTYRGYPIGELATHATFEEVLNRLIRPRSRYTGPDTRPVVPVDRR